MKFSSWFLMLIIFTSISYGQDSVSVQDPQKVRGKNKEIFVIKLSNIDIGKSRNEIFKRDEFGAICSGTYQISLYRDITKELIARNKIIELRDIYVPYNKPLELKFKMSDGEGNPLSIEEFEQINEKGNKRKNILCYYPQTKIEKEQAVINTIKQLILNGQHFTAISFGKDYLEYSERRRSIDFSNTNLDINEEDLNSIRFNLGFFHFNINNTSVQKRMFKNPLNRSCQIRTNVICGATFLRRRSSYCKEKEFNEIASPNCPSTSYKKGKSKVCGIKSYGYGYGEKQCGAVYKKKEDCAICGAKTTFLGGGCIEAYKCRDSSFGIESLKSCHHPDFGIEYHECYHPSFGSATYQVCSHKSHGLVWADCEVPEHGYRNVNTCYLEVNENDELQTCGDSKALDELFDF